MKIRSIFAGTAIAALALAGGMLAPAGFTVVPQAEAARVSVSLSVFYDELEPHGDWVRYHDAYVFVPSDVDVNWRPYTVGHWVHTKRYGWMWVSEEPFGWATYHYGRWGFADDIGWYWVPGKRWAPAWVSWRRSNDYIVWAPLPPSRGAADVSISITAGDIPEFYWVAVPARRFLEPDIHVVVVREDREIRRVVERTEFVGAPRITNNIVINNVIDVDVVAEATGRKVKTVEVRETDNPRQARSSGDEVTVFQGDVTAEDNAKPREVRDAGDVRKKKRQDGGTEDAAGAKPEETPETTTGATTPPATETDQSATPPATGEQPAAKTAEEPAAKDKPKKKPTAKSDVKDDTPAQAADEKATETKGKKKPAAQSDTVEQTPADTPVKKKAKRGKAAEQENDEPADDVTGTTTVPAEPNAAEDAQAKGKAKPAKEKSARKGKAKDCDPQTDDCSAQ